MTTGSDILIVSEDPFWCEAMTIALEDAGARVIDRESGLPEGVLIDALKVRVSGTGDPAARALQLNVDAVRTAHPTVPIIVMSSVPIDAFTRYEGADSRLRVVIADSAHAESLAKRVLHEIADIAAADRLPAAFVTEPPGAAAQSATIEITISEATLRCDVRVGSLSDQWGPSSWTTRPEIINIDEEYACYETQHQIATLDPLLFAIAGRRLLSNLFREPIAFSKRFIDKVAPNGCDIFYRFVLQDGDLENVPFELVATENKDEYLRYVYPLSRKLSAREVHRSPDRLVADARHRRKVLFILSDVQGILSVPGQTFKGQSSLSLNPLKQLRTELNKVRKLYGAGNVTVLTLRRKRDNSAAIDRVFRDEKFDIVHFAGHSLRADQNGQVYLVLPEDARGRVIPYDVEHFAALAAENDVRLVILSSCEGTSGRALSRMASNGVPAIVGFRWPVVDQDAALFTPVLHEELRNGGAPVPLSIAFHRALRRMKVSAPGRSSWFSPILMIQHSDWHNFAAEG